MKYLKPLNEVNEMHDVTGYTSTIPAFTPRTEDLRVGIAGDFIYLGQIESDFAQLAIDKKQAAALAKTIEKLLKQ